MPKVDCIIVGAGLAGSILALDFLSQSKTVAIISDPVLPTSSGVAGGLVNPITGKYLAKTWLAEELFTYLHRYYRDLEEKFNGNFYHQTGLYRPFTGEEHRKTSIQQIEKHALQDYITVSTPPDGVENFLNPHTSGLLSPKAGWVDVPLMLQLVHQYLREHCHWIEENFVHSALYPSQENIAYKDIEAKNIVFCEGFYANQNPYFSWLPFNPVKGETLVGTIENYNVNCIVNQGKWLVPLENNKVRLGATYSWHELDFLPTQKAKEDLLDAAGKMLKGIFKIEKHQAGVRPATKDRRPFIGSHPVHKNVHIFNGLGTKGVSLAPYFSRSLVKNILFNEVIEPGANIERFYTLYS